MVEDSQVKTVYSDPSIITGAPDVDLQCEQAKKICTKARNTNLITNYFEQIDKKKNEGQVSQLNKITNLHAKIERIEKEKMKLTEQVESLRDENYKLKKQLKEGQKDNGNEKKIDNKENNHVEKCKIQVKGKDKESKTATKLSKKKEPDENIQKPGRAYQELNKESMKRQLVENKEKQSKQQQQQQCQDNQTSDKNDKPYMIIAGDSLTKGLKGWLMSRKKKVKVQTFSGATAQDMKDYIKPLVAKKPAHIYLHIGTNDVANLSADQVKDNIFEIARNIRNKGINCTVSSLITRKDQYSVNVEEINNLLYRELPTGINIIKHENITAQHLNQGGIHLNKRGDGALALNFINDIRSC